LEAAGNPWPQPEVFLDQASACPPDVSSATTLLLQTRRLVEWAALSFLRVESTAGSQSKTHVQNNGIFAFIIKEGGAAGPQSKTHVQKHEISAFIIMKKVAHGAGIRITKARSSILPPAPPLVKCAAPLPAVSWLVAQLGEE
jgi:hypothetical protein